MKKMRKKKVLLLASSLVITAAALAFTMARPAYAASGWTRDSGEWEYLGKDNQPVTNAWKARDGVLNYLGSDGKLVKNTLVQSGEDLYYVNEEGQRVKNQWELFQYQEGGQVEKDQFQNGWYYFGTNGKAYNYNGGNNVKKQIGGSTYAFDDNGRMLTGWLDENLEPLTGDDGPIMLGVYYADEDGALLRDQWLNYTDTNDSVSDNAYLGADEKDYSDYQEIWMYFGHDFKRVSGSADEIKQKKIDGTTYGFDRDGVMIPWWSPVASGSDAQASAQAARFFSGADGGGLLKNTWIWMYPSEEMDEKDYQDEEYSWWHTNSDGKLDKDSIHKINNKYYAFDSLGRMQTGFVMFQGRNQYVGSYKVDEWEGDNFKYGYVDKDGDLSAIPGFQGSDLYLFGPDELNDGSMKTGKNIKVELSDAIYTFGFASGGIAYGSGDQLQRVKDSFYINGLRLDADDGFKYGVVLDGSRDSDGTVHGDCYAVDIHGRIQKGDKRVLRDRDGCWLLLLDDKFMARVDDEDKPVWLNDGEQGPGFYHYDRYSDDKYGSLITTYGAAPDLGGLPDEEKLFIRNY